MYVTLSQLADPAEGASLVGYDPGQADSIPRTVEARLRETVSPEDYGAGNGNANDDTAAFKAMIAATKLIRLTPGKVYYLNDDVTADHPSADNWSFSVVGVPGVAPDEKPKIVVTKPGVTPFPCATLSQLVGVHIEYAETGTTPAVSGDTWPYARAVEIESGTIGIVGGKLTLTVAGGGLLGNVTRGSAVAVLDDPGKTEDYWVNNFASFDHIFQIESVESDTTAILQGELAASHVDVPMHIRGCAMSLIWGLYQPTGCMFTDNRVGAVPGFAVMAMGSQKTRVEGNLIADLSGPHLGLLYSGNGAGIHGDSGGGQGFLAAPGINHENSCEKNMIFFSCGGIAINGWVDSRIVQNQFDQGQTQNDALATYFPNFQAVYTLSCCTNMTVENLSAEDSPCPDGIKLYACANICVRDAHAHDLSYSSYLLHFESCLSCSYERVRNSGGIGDPAKSVRFTGHGVGPLLEVQGNQGGRGGAGIHCYQNGVFDGFAVSLDQRDSRWIKGVIAEATLKAHSGSTYAAAPVSWDDYGGFVGFDFFILEEVLVDHGQPWSSIWGTPQLKLGVAGNDDAVFGYVDLDEAPGHWLDGRNFPGGATGPIAFAAGQLGSQSLLATIQSGGGLPMNDAGFICDDLVIYARVSGVRS